MDGYYTFLYCQLSLAIVVCKNTDYIELRANYIGSPVLLCMSMLPH
jgi:hypothetical protein